MLVVVHPLLHRLTTIQTIILSDTNSLWCSLMAMVTCCPIRVKLWPQIHLFSTY